ncbi:hypothetical protein AVEN_38548-1, partial [Araneus ventricosus]
CPHADKGSNDSCSACYESQLAQLQEQFVSIMLENQQLVNEIKELKSQSLVEQLTKQLEKERERYRVLSERVHEKESTSLSSKSPRLRRFARKEKHSTDKSKSSEAAGESSGMTVILEKEDPGDIMREAEEEDGETTVPKSFSGPIGAQLSKCEKLPVVNFKSNECEISEIEWKILSEDQQYVLDISYAVKSGSSPEDLSVHEPGPLSHSRWLTTANRILRLYLSIENPTDEHKILVSFIPKSYMPVWVHIKKGHFQNFPDFSMAEYHYLNTCVTSPAYKLSSYFTTAQFSVEIFMVLTALVSAFCFIGAIAFVKNSKPKEVHTEITPLQPEPQPFPPAEKLGWYSYIRNWIISYYYRLAEDFSETAVDDDDSGDFDPEGDPLTVRKLVLFLSA